MPHNPPSFRLQQSALPRTSCVRYVTTESAMSQKHQQLGTTIAEPIYYRRAHLLRHYNVALYPSTEQATSYGGAQSLSSQYYTFVDSGTNFILMRCTIAHDRDTIAPAVNYAVPAADDSVAGSADIYVYSYAHYTGAGPPKLTTEKVAQSEMASQRSYAASDVVWH